VADSASQFTFSELTEAIVGMCDADFSPADIKCLYGGQPEFLKAFTVATTLRNKRKREREPAPTEESEDSPPFKRSKTQDLEGNQAP